jgi:ribose-phosphate pyrophosphokinase
MSSLERDEIRIFAGRSGRPLAELICRHLDLPMADAAVEMFPDGELIVKVNEDVRGRDCFVVQSTSDPVNDSLMELLIFIDCLRRASARRITAVIPYFGYARQDRKDEGRVPITAKLVANVITAAGADRVLCMDLHAAQLQGFFDIPVDHLSATPVLFEHFASIREELGDLVLVSPDVGNVKVANTYADLLDADLAIVDKRRQSGDRVASKNLIGSVKGRTVLMVDDMISTAGTIAEAARLVCAQGARTVIAAATHAVFVGLAIQRILDSPIGQVIVTDTIPDGDRLDRLRDRIKILTVGRVFGDAIHRIHHNLSVSALFRLGDGAKRPSMLERNS